MTTQAQQEKWYSPHLAHKKILKMGLGPLGRSFGDILFLARHGTHIVVTDFRKGSDIDHSIDNIKKELEPHEFKRIDWVLGKHRKKDFESADIVLRASAVPLDSPYIEAAHKKKRTVRSSAAWVCELVKEEFGDSVTIIGVTGSKGKSTVTGAIEYMLKQSDKRFHMAGNIRGVANLPVLDEVQEGDIILMELDSWQLQGFGEAHISPDIALVTNFFPDHMDYYKGSMRKYFTDKAHIFRYQKHPCCFVSRQAKMQIKKYGRTSDTERVRSVTKQVLPEEWSYALIGTHNLRNLALVYKLGMYLELPEPVIKKALEGYGGMSGRMESLGSFKGIIFWNDNNSTTPESTTASLEALSGHYGKRIIWWGGGADKKADYEELARSVTKHSKQQILFEGSGTDKITPYLYQDEYELVSGVEEAIGVIKNKASRGDIVLFSPACTSFGMFDNEYDRNDQVVKAIKKFGNK